MKHKIGSFVYPLDNSYAFSLKTGKEPEKYLAGTQLGDKPIKVKVISNPFMMPVTERYTTKHKVYVYEFVFVKDKNGEKFCVLNHLKLIK